MIEDCGHDTDEDGNDLNTLSSSRLQDSLEIRDKVHHPLTDRGKIHHPLTELDWNEAKRETDTASHMVMTSITFPSIDVKKSNSKVIQSDNNSRLLLQPKESTLNSQKENKMLFTVGELSDDDFDL